MGVRPSRASRRLTVAQLVFDAGHGRRRGLLGMVWVSAAVVLVVGGTSLAVGQWGGEYDPVRPGTGRTASEVLQPAPGWRLESFLDVVVEVPDSWGPTAAPASDWCADRGQPTAFPEQPYVDTRGPYAGLRSIGCFTGGEDPDLHGGGVPREHWAPHVWFVATPAPGGVGEVPDGRVSDNGWTRLVRTVGSAKVLVLTDRAHLDEAERIIESARQTNVDHHGCDVSSPIQAGKFVRPPVPFDVARLDAVDVVAVCHYDLDRPMGSPGLLASHELAGRDAKALLAAIQAAPAGGGPDTPDTCVKDMWGDTAIVLRLMSGAAWHEAYVYYDWCFGNGIDDGTTLRALSTENCAPLWSERVVSWGGSSAPFAVCHPSSHAAANAAKTH